MTLAFYLYQPIGCNKRLGSRRTVDRCGVCGGKGRRCQVETGVVRETLDRGYNTILTIPPHARQVDIVKRRGDPTAVFGKLTILYHFHRFSFSWYVTVILYCIYYRQ